MDHVIEGRHLFLRIGNDRIIHCRMLRLIDVVDPALVRIQRIDADGDNFHASLFEFRRNLGDSPQLRGADRSLPSEV